MRALAVAWLALLASGAWAHVAERVPESLFEPPPPGTYELPPIQEVDEYVLVTPDGATTHLPGLAAGQVGVVSFVYRSCTQASGCPLALAVLRRLDRELARRPQLARRVRLATVSFDPARDTPERMGDLARMLAPRGDWRFLTVSEPQQIRPVLADYSQDVVQLEDAVLRHVLKVFLVDAERRVRNIYSAGFLSWQLLLNDIETVLGGEQVEE